MNRIALRQDVHFFLSRPGIFWPQVQLNGNVMDVEHILYFQNALYPLMISA